MADNTRAGVMTKTITVLLLAAPIVACGTTHAIVPAPTGDPGARVHVIREPNGFLNVAFSCYGRDGVYVTSHASLTPMPSSIAVVANDPNCK